MTQDRYLRRGIKDRQAGDVLEGIVPRSTSPPLPMNLMPVPVALMRAAVQERSQAERHLINAMRAARGGRHRWLATGPQFQKCSDASVRSRMICRSSGSLNRARRGRGTRRSADTARTIRRGDR